MQDLIAKYRKLWRYPLDHANDQKGEVWACLLELETLLLAAGLELKDIRPPRT